MGRDDLRPPLPTVDGVAPSRQTLPAGGRWATVLDFLAERHAAVGPESAYRAGACVYYYREPGGETRVPFEERVLHRDEHILVADKPHFLAVAPAGRVFR